MFKQIGPSSLEQTLVDRADLGPPPLDASEGVIHRRLLRILPNQGHQGEISAIERAIELHEPVSGLSRICDLFAAGHRLLNGCNAVRHGSSCAEAIPIGADGVLLRAQRSDFRESPVVAYLPFIRLFLPTMDAPLRIAVLLSDESSLPAALLFRAVFERANRMLAGPRYRLELVSAAPLHSKAKDVRVITRRMRGRYDYLVVTPYDGIDEHWRPDPRDVALVRRQRAHGDILASACLGALTLAEAGVLDGREATTHWSWDREVRARYPQVAWNTRRILCDQRAVITAGGYLAAVDLGLHIVAATSSPETARSLGQMMLADSARQHQSLYALRLAAAPLGCGALPDIEEWLELRLRSAPTSTDMARHCNMSLRSFHRRFREAYGITPRKFLQLKRIEVVRRQLAAGARSIEQILQDVGVGDATSFRRIFHRELGLSPAEYRRQCRTAAGAAHPWVRDTHRTDR